MSEVYIANAEIVLPCRHLEDTLAFFCDELGFTLHRISPADDPTLAVISGHGLRLQLDTRAQHEPGVLRIYTHPSHQGPRPDQAPNGTRIEWLPDDPPLPQPHGETGLTLVRMASGGWSTGRAGMQYRDLIPNRQGGRFIASHIRIPQGGPVPDYVHHHRVRFQMIYCCRGWVRVVYQDQGEPFILEPGDCVLQPPGIRHRVLKSAPGLEVVEISSPAEHDTLTDPDLTLPTGKLRPERQFGGQRFVRHIANAAAWTRGPWSDCRQRDLGLTEGTSNLATARVIVAGKEAQSPVQSHDGEFMFRFVLAGKWRLGIEDRPEQPLDQGDAVTIPPGMSHTLSGDRDAELLEVQLPALPGNPT